MQTGSDIARRLKLEPVPDEGGSFARLYTAEAKTGNRPAASSIVYLLRSREISRWHKLKCDEVWMYHEGSSAVQLLLFPDGKCEERRIGPDIRNGEQLQSIVPAGVWQSTVLTRREDDCWGLFGTVCIPGFTYDAYCGGEIADLVKNYPEAAERIRCFGETFHKTE